MRLRVNMAPFNGGAGGQDQAHVFIECGTGEQILRWVAYTAVGRLAYLRGDTPLLYVPQSVLAPDGTPLDVDTVLNEVCADGDFLTVEFSNGPEAFKTRWEGRPTTPPFQWGKEGEIGVSDNEWLEELDIKSLGLAQNPAALEQDLHAVKEVFLQYAGGLQALYKYYDAQKEDEPRMLDRLSLDQFRAMMLDARIATDNFKAAAIDKVFHDCQEDLAMRAEATTRQKSQQTSVAHATVLTLQEFLVSLVWLAAAKYQLGLESPTWGYSELSQQLSHFITDYLFANLGTPLSDRLKSIEPALTDNAVLLLKKGRRLTEQTLDSCQLRRVATAERRIDIKYMCVHLKKWGMLGARGIDLSTLVVILLFAKHPIQDVSKMLLHKHPMEVNYDEFERLLLGLSWKMYQAKEEKEEPFEEFMGEALDEIYKKAGVLVELQKM